MKVFLFFTLSGLPTLLHTPQTINRFKKQFKRWVPVNYDHFKVPWQILRVQRKHAYKSATLHEFLQCPLDQDMGLSENSVPRKTQWFCWSLSLLNGYFIGGINPIFRHTHMSKRRSVAGSPGVTWGHLGSPGSVGGYYPLADAHAHEEQRLEWRARDPRDPMPIILMEETLGVCIPCSASGQHS